MATRGTSELTKCERQAREAINAMKNDHIWKLGEYKTNITGRSLQATLAREFCTRNGVENGDTISAFMHSETGALVILPRETEPESED